MDALDVISLDEAKYSLVVDYPDKDGDITRYIKTAVAIVERYTNYALYQRAVTYTLPLCGNMEIYDYPISFDEGNTTYDRVLSVVLSGQSGAKSDATIGYADVADIPSPLIDACYKIITYLSENRDIYEENLPSDVQGLINSYRRSATF